MKNLISKDWWMAAGTRALRTFAQTALSVIGITAIPLQKVDWLLALSTATTAAIISLLTSLKGLPEVDKGDK